MVIVFSVSHLSWIILGLNNHDMLKLSRMLGIREKLSRAKVMQLAYTLLLMKIYFFCIHFVPQGLTRQFSFGLLITSLSFLSNFLFCFCIVVAFWQELRTSMFKWYFSPLSRCCHHESRDEFKITNLLAKNTRDHKPLSEGECLITISTESHASWIQWP